MANNPENNDQNNGDAPNISENVPTIDNPIITFENSGGGNASENAPTITNPIITFENSGGGNANETANTVSAVVDGNDDEPTTDFSEDIQALEDEMRELQKELQIAAENGEVLTEEEILEYSADMSTLQTQINILNFMQEMENRGSLLWYSALSTDNEGIKFLTDALNADRLADTSNGMLNTNEIQRINMTIDKMRGLVDEYDSVAQPLYNILNAFDEIPGLGRSITKPLKKAGIREIKKKVKILLKRIQERIRRLKRPNRKRRKDRRCGSNPVYIANGASVQDDPSFLLSGIIPVYIDSGYISNLSILGPIGYNRTSSIDLTIKESPNDPSILQLLRDDGQLINFKRPKPIPGRWEVGDSVEDMRLAQGPKRRLYLKTDLITTHFKKYKDGIWRIEKIVDNFGNEVLHERNASGLLKTINTAEDLSLVFSNNEHGLRTAVDLKGRGGSLKRILTYAYSKNKDLIFAHATYGDKVEYHYDEHHQRVSYTLNSIYTAQHFYENGRVVKVETNSNLYNNDRFEYDLDNSITRYYPNGREDCVETFYLDDEGVITKEINALGGEKQYVYNDLGYLSAEINGEGEKSSVTYDARCNIKSFRDGEGRESFLYWSAGNQLEIVIDNGGNTLDYVYGPNGEIRSIIDAEGNRTDFRTNESGLVTGAMRHDGLIESSQYDKYNQLTATIDYRGEKAYFNYDEFGRVISIIDNYDRETKFIYEDQLGFDFWQPSQIIRPDGVSSITKFNHKAAQTIFRDGEGREVIYHYGQRSLLSVIEDNNGGLLKFSYDGQERLTQVENQLGEHWCFDYDGAGRVVSETDFSGVKTDYQYDKADRIIETRYDNGTKLNFAYDKSGLLIKEQVFDAAGTLEDEIHYNYDLSARLQRIENKTAVINYKFDKLGRVIEEAVNGRSVKNSYDCCGNRVSRDIGGKLIEASYDPLGALTSFKIGTHQPLQMQLGRNGQEIRRSNSLGFKLDQNYDLIGQLTKQQAGFDITSLGAGLDGAIEAQNRGLNPLSLASQAERLYQWSKNFEPLKIDDKKWGTIQYDYNKNAQISETHYSNSNSERFRYDKAMNIAGFGNDSNPKKFENWLSKKGGAIREAKGPNGERVHLTYDSRNRVIERRVEKNGFRIKIWKYQWDVKDRLAACITPEGERWTYHYDPLGRRIFKINASIAQKALLAQSPNVTELEKNRGAYHEDNHQRGSGDMSSETIVGTAYLWDANTIAEEAPLKASGEADCENSTKWYYEPDTFRPIAKETPNGELFYIVNDHLGTPREMFSEDGKLVWAAQYRTWGAVHKIWQADNDDNIHGPYPPPIRGNLAFKYDTVEAQAAQTCPIRFQGQWEDAETGLYYNRFRYYDPLTAQYISADPIGLLGGGRINGYVTQPNILVDPLGLISVYRKTCLAGGGRSTTVPFQVHHVIPQQLFGEETSVGDFLRATGINKHIAYNLYAMPSKEDDGIAQRKLIHSGSHDNYNVYVRNLLSGIESKYPTINSKNCKCARADVYRLMNFLKGEIWLKGQQYPGTNLNKITWL